MANLISPHYCCSCGQIGDVLCEYCKFDIVDEAFMQCLKCQSPTQEGAMCKQCSLPYQKAWCVGERTGTLEKLINCYKFERVQKIYTTLADLLDEALPILPPETIVVPIPTIPTHIRVRGYDHCFLFAKQFARKRRLTHATYLARREKTTQRNASRKTREQQARRAFTCNTQLSATTPYLLIDDVYTTGATLKYAAQALKDAGAQMVWVAVVSYQPFKT